MHQLTRKQKRQLLFQLSQIALTTVLKGLPRRMRRAMARVYASATYRRLEGLPRFADHTPERVHQGVVDWIIAQIAQLEAQCVDTAERGAVGDVNVDTNGAITI